MVLTLEDNYQNALINNGLNSKEFCFFEGLFDAMRDNKLFFLASFDFYNFFLSLYKSTISNRTAKMIERLINEGAISISEARQIKPLITICSSSDNYRFQNNSFFVPFCDVPDNLTSCICGENPDDANFYKFVFSSFTSKNDYINVETIGMGGGDIKTYLQNMVDNQRVFLCICDSDIKYPGCDEGCTAKDAREFFQTNNPKCSTLYVLSVHEKENLFPFEMYNLQGNMKEIVQYVISLNCDDYRDYFDIKDGMKKADLNNPALQPAAWHSFYDCVFNYAQTNNYYEQKLPKKYVIGIGSSALSERIEQPVDINSYKSLLTSRQKNDIDSICGLMLIYGYRYTIKNP